MGHTREENQSGEIKKTLFHIHILKDIKLIYMKR